MAKELEAITHVVSTLEDMDREAAVFVSDLGVEKNAATLVTLSGELGAGKTTFTQYLAQALGVTGTVNSPTFVIEKIYEIPEYAANGSKNTFTRLVHIDAYRLKSSEDLNVLGFEESLKAPGTLVLLEWPEQVPGVAERADVRISIELLLDSARKITYA